MKEILQEIEQLTRGAANRPTQTGIPRVVMIRGEVSPSQLSAVYEPMIGLVLQGGKTLSIGDRVLHYQSPSYFVLPVEVPVTGMVHQGTEGIPYLSVGLALEHEVLEDLLGDLPRDAGPRYPSRELAVCPAEKDVLEPWLRMLRLIRRPRDVPALAPVYEREILYGVLQGPQGWMLRDLARSGSSLHRIQQTVTWIKRNLSESFGIGSLAAQAGMSITTYHRHFKAATGMSPIQFQKHLRLLEARKLLTVAARSVSTAAYEVGYESASQFSREYTRLFGTSPSRDVNLRD